MTNGQVLNNPFDTPGEVSELEKELLQYGDAIADMISQVRSDNALINIHSGLNVPGRDKLTANSIFTHYNYLSPQQRTNFRYTNFIVGNLVEILPAAMCDKFFIYEAKNDSDMTEWMIEPIDEVCFYFKEALEQAREQGGAGIVVYVDDGKELDQPVDFANIETITGYNVLNCNDLRVHEWNTDTMSLQYGEIENYTISGSQVIIHESRIIKFHGLASYKRLVVENRGWGFSVIDRAIKKIINLDQSSDAIATSIQNFNQTILFIKDLAKKLASNKKEQVKEHVRTVAFLQSVLGIIALDADYERYEIHARNYSGLDTMLEHLVQMASGSCDIPSTILLNRSATAGNNKGGVSSNSGAQGRKEWSEYVSGRQKFDMHPQVKQFIKFQECRKDNPNKGILPKRRIITYPSILQLTDAEKATITEQNSRETGNLIKNLIVFPSEVRAAMAKGIPLEAAIDMSKDPSVEAANPNPVSNPDPGVNPEPAVNPELAANPRNPGLKTGRKTAIPTVVNNAKI